MGGCFANRIIPFFYVGGEENGAVVGLINYPRFPKTDEGFHGVVRTLAELLRVEMGQLRVTVLFPDHSVMLEGGEESS